MNSQYPEKKRRFVKKKQDSISITTLKKGILDGNRSSLAKAITLIESNASHHYEWGQELLGEVMPHTGNSLRIGITGVPGAGKSTFIEAFGEMLCHQGHRVAVLAIDPSSSLSGGSILGDKTRMEQLSKNPKAFVRPSPTAGTLGGVHRKTNETLLLCEAAGYDIIIIETVGVGQSEVMVRQMVDFFLLLAITGAGDELQGMKKGIMELADAMVVNKADGDNKPLAEKTKRELNQILHFLVPATKGWSSRAYTCSALEKSGLRDLWDVIKEFEKQTKEIGSFQDRRTLQKKEWFYTMLKDRILSDFFLDERVKPAVPQMEEKVKKGSLTTSKAIEELLHLYKQP
ncbi:methylmalonyl Co-A mutase-associated GTPase MeaB [Rossellomorea aquimaris]|uniref:methylmalonyl Co-A mutase-associated GTPase MeaB n=1 Tax=Rossellomorea aquimaris TaxID=189382 RepID=UPI001CD7C6D5|nr:methylmalonyl Co-A mutase-associated GTPase MeaB [Rossellomorea aquimaris]MCA1054753.1 methylmalonyl Co-A mutase-associated GTPase MeaB [Rossellomorea aquimaris]